MKISTRPGRGNVNSKTWAPAGGGAPPTPETEKIVGEKCCYFPELYKMRKVREDGIENGLKVNFPLRFVNYKIFSTNLNSYWFLAQTRKYLPICFLISFIIIKDFH